MSVVLNSFFDVFCVLFFLVECVDVACGVVEVFVAGVLAEDFEGDSLVVEEA